MIARTSLSRRITRWIALSSVVGLMALGGLSFLNRAGTLHGEDGVVWKGDSGSLRATRVGAGSPGEIAGIEKGDRLLSIEKVPAETERQIRDLLWARGGVPTRYQVSKDGIPRNLVVIPRLSAEENRIFYYLWVVGLLTLGMGCLVAWKLPTEPASGLLFLLAAAFYLVLTFSPSGQGGLLDWTFYWGDLVGRLLAPPLLIHFVLRVSRGDRPQSLAPWSGFALYLPPIALLGWNFYLISMRGALKFSDPIRVVAVKDRFEIFYLIVAISVAAVMLFFRLWTASRARIRWRLRWLTLSSSAALLPLALFYLTPTVLGIPAGTVGELSVFPLALLPLGFAAALFHDRTVDLDRSLRLVIRWVFGGAVLAGGALAISWSLGHLPGGRLEAGLLAEVIFPLSLSMLLTWILRRPLLRLVDRLLGGPPPEVAHTLLEFRAVLNGEIRLDILAGNLLEKLREFFRVDKAFLLMREGQSSVFRPVPNQDDTSSDLLPETCLDDLAATQLASLETFFLLGDPGPLPPEALAPLAAAGARYLFPMSVRGDLKALLLLGVHRDGSPLDSVELETLAALATQAARGVEGARLYREIEERIAQEKKLRAQSQGILEASRIGILLADGTGRVAAANRAVGEILGRNDFLGERLEKVLPRALLLLLDRNRMPESSRKDEGRVYRFSLGTADGKERVINVTRAMIHRDVGGGQVYTLDDVTEQVRREEMMRRQDHLASVGLLASQVAHEVNTPLTGIASYAQILMSRMAARLPEMDLLKKIEAQAFRAAGIAGSVLNFTRRKEREALEVFEPGPMMAECLTLFEPHLKGKKIRITTERAPSLPLLRGHRGKLQQVVMNLLLNAVDALPEGGEICLGLDRDGDGLKIRVSDNGVGIPEEVLPRVFEPFFTSRTNGKGTGLGLSVVQEIIKEHEGTIRVKSTLGTGSVFTVILPAYHGSELRAAEGS